MKQDYHQHYHVDTYEKPVNRHRTRQDDRERRARLKAEREAARREAERLPEAPPVKMNRTRPAREQ